MHPMHALKYTSTFLLVYKLKKVDATLSVTFIIKFASFDLMRSDKDNASKNRRSSRYDVLVLVDNVVVVKALQIATVIYPFLFEQCGSFFK